MRCASVLRVSGMLVLLTVAAGAQGRRPFLAPAQAAATVVKATAVTAPNAPCPKTVTFSFIVRVTKPGTLYFRRVNSQGYRDPQVHSVNFARTGEFDLGKMLPDQFVLTMAQPFSGWAGVHIDANPAGR